MTGRRAIVGLCMLCALLISAVAAQNAGASTGTTGTAPPGTGYTGNIKAFGGETLLHSVQSGIEMEFKSTEFKSTSASMQSLVNGSEHASLGSGSAEFKNVTVVKPPGKGCKVSGGEFETNTLKATTVGQGMGVRFEPSVASGLAEFVVEGCGPTLALMALNGFYEVTGSIIGEPAAGTNETVFTRAATTTQGTLRLRGQKAGFDGVLKLETTGGDQVKSSTVTTP